MDPGLNVTVPLAFLAGGIKKAPGIAGRSGWA